MAEKKGQTQKGPTQEDMRQAALTNLSNKDLLALAGTFYSHQMKHDGGVGYGSGDDAVELYKYLPGLKSETGQQIVLQSLIGSREGGRRYSGQTSEYGILENAAQNLNVGGVKVSDAIKLAGLDGEINPKYGDKYLSDLAKGSDEDKEVFKRIVTRYNQNLADKTVAEALVLRSRDNSGLEDIFVKPKDKPKK